MDQPELACPAGIGTEILTSSRLSRCDFLWFLCRQKTVRKGTEEDLTRFRALEQELQDKDVKCKDVHEERNNFIRLRVKNRYVKHQNALMSILNPVR